VLFDTDDGGQIMVSYDAPPPVTRPRHDNTTAASLSGTPTTAIGKDESADCGHQDPSATENELLRQNGNANQVAEASSSTVTDTLKSELCEEEQAKKPISKNQRDSADAPRRPMYDQKAITVTKQKEPRRSISRITSTRRQSLSSLPSTKSAVNDQIQSVAGKANGSVTERPPTCSDISRTATSRTKTDSKKAETSASRSVSTSRRSSLMKATTSSLAKRCENNGDNADVKGSLAQSVTDRSASFTTSLTSKITKLVKGGSKPAPNKAAAATTPKYNSRLSLDVSARPRPGLIVGKTGVTSQPRDNKGDRKATSIPSELNQSLNVGQGHVVTSSVRGVVSGHGRGAVQGLRKPADNLTKSASHIALRGEVAKNPVVTKSVSFTFVVLVNMKQRGLSREVFIRTSHEIRYSCRT